MAADKRKRPQSRQVHDRIMGNRRKCVKCDKPIPTDNNVQGFLFNAPEISPLKCSDFVRLITVTLAAKETTSKDECQTFRADYF